uniref:LEC14B protein-like n=1 Tax=Nelumbo nucifera TaxID=4432 RepID=A0A822YW94_NELNU|nr:TPA_asm: hypothetical protein HUJ06_012349 [Nelumbo nucifera]
MKLHSVPFLQIFLEILLHRTSLLVQEIHDGLDFSVDDDGEYSFGIFSVKFSNDGRELVAGSNDNSIYVYDLCENKLTLRISAHSVL